MSLKIVEFEAKTKGEALEKAQEELKITENDMLYKVEEKKGNLFK